MEAIGSLFAAIPSTSHDLDKPISPIENATFELYLHKSNTVSFFVENNLYLEIAID